MSDFSITSSKTLIIDSSHIIIGPTCTNLEFGCNIFPTITYDDITINISNFSNFSNISSNAVNFSTTLLNGFNVSMDDPTFGQNIVLSQDGSTIAIGSPYYNSNAGRVDIYANASLLNTILGDAPNSYFGQSLVISENGSTVLMGSPAYRSGCGIYNQYYNGQVNISYIGASNMSYGQNILIDPAGNSIMYTNANVSLNASTTVWTYYNSSNLVANPYNFSINGALYSNNFSDFRCTIFNNLITNGNTSAYLLNVSASNISLLLVNNISFNAISSGWPLSNVSATSYTTVNNKDYFAVIYIQNGTLHVYIGNFYRTNTIQSFQYSDTPGPIVASLNNQNILSVKTNDSVIRLYSIQTNDTPDNATCYQINTFAGSLFALSTNASVIAVANSPNITVYNIPDGITLLSTVGTNVALNASGTVVATSYPPYGFVNVYQNYLPYVNIVGPPNMSYGKQIQLNASGTVLATATNGLVQVFTNLDNLSNVSGNLSTNTSTILTDIFDVGYNTNVVYSNGVNVLNTSYITHTTTHIYNSSGYIYDLAYNHMSLINSSYSVSSSTITYDSILNIGLDSHITEINIGAIMTPSVTCALIQSSTANIQTLNTSNISNSGLIQSTSANIQTINSSSITNSELIQSLSANIQTLNTSNISNSELIQSTSANIQNLNTSNISNSGLIKTSMAYITSGYIQDFISYNITNGDLLQSVSGNIQTMSTSNIYNSELIQSVSANIQTLNTSTITNSGLIQSLSANIQTMNTSNIYNSELIQSGSANIQTMNTSNITNSELIQSGSANIQTLNTSNISNSELIQSVSANIQTLNTSNIYNSGTITTHNFSLNNLSIYGTLYVANIENSNLLGPTGANGITGPTGLNGYIGNDGSTGPTGIQGTAGSIPCGSWITTFAPAACN